MLKLEGMAVKFGTENSYNESFAPDALDAFLEKQGNKPLPMGFMHELRIGEWTKLEKRDGGLYVEGYVFPEAESDIRQLMENVKRKGEKQELSVTFAMRGNQRGQFTNKRLLEKEMTFGRRPAGTVAVDHLHVQHATLAEISLVDRGAFPGTWFKELAI